MDTILRDIRISEAGPQQHFKQSTPNKDLEWIMMMESAQSEPNGFARCVSLCALTIHLFEVLQQKRLCPKIVQLLNVLLPSIRVSSLFRADTCHKYLFLYLSQICNKVLVRISCDMLSILTEHSIFLLDHQPEVVRSIIEGLCSSIVHFVRLSFSIKINSFKIVSNHKQPFFLFCFSTNGKQLNILDYHLTHPLSARLVVGYT